MSTADIMTNPLHARLGDLLGAAYDMNAGYRCFTPCTNDRPIAVVCIGTDPSEAGLLKEAWDALTDDLTPTERRIHLTEILDRLEAVRGVAKPAQMAEGGQA